MTTAIGMTLLFGAYTIGIWGYCLVKSYDVPFGKLFAQTWPGAQVKSQAPTDGHKLGQISGSTAVTDPGQLRAGQ